MSKKAEKPKKGEKPKKKKSVKSSTKATTLNNLPCEKCKHYEYVESIAALADKQIRNASWAQARRIVYFSTWVLIVIGFYSLWSRDETCAQLNRNVLNSTV